MLKALKTGVAAAVLLVGSAAYAAVCSDTSDDGSPTRTWTLNAASGCAMGEDNPQAADILAEWPSTPWTNEGDITGDGDSSAFLDVDLTTGDFGGKNTAGTWTLSAAFWLTYGEAVISMHVGNGNEDGLADHASFLLLPGDTSGTWSYVQDPEAGSGGGLSNFHIWGRGTPAPEPGSLALLGLGLAGLALARRRKPA